MVSTFERRSHRAPVWTAALVLGLLAAASTLASVPSRAAFVSTTLKAPQFDPDRLVYVPGETIQWTIRATPGDQFDVEIQIDADGDATTPGDSVFQRNNAGPVPDSGQLNMDYTVLESREDGSSYWLRVYRDTWIDDGRPAELPFSNDRIRIQGYRFELETDRASFLPGDTVTVTWSANRIRDGSLAAAGSGKIWAYDSAGGQLIAPEPYTFTQPTGSLTIRLSPTADPALDGAVWGWFNDTPSAPLRHDSALDTFEINELGAIVTTSVPTYQPGAVVTVRVQTKITPPPGNPTSADPGAAAVGVNITVANVTTGQVVEAYGSGVPLPSDAHGEVTHVFQLASPIAEGTQFEVQADASAHAGAAPALIATDSTIFAVHSAAGISVQLTPEKAQYASGDTVQLVADVYRAGGAVTESVTFVWEARDQTPGAVDALLHRQTETKPGNQSSYMFVTNTSFRGFIEFRVTVDDGDRNRATASRVLEVALGWLIVSAEPTEFSPPTPDAATTLTASWTLRSNVIRNPTYYYQITDAAGLVVRSGTATGPSVSYPVPQVPSSQYTFTVTASEAGQVVTGSATVFAVGGYRLTIALDRPSYLPGDTIRIDYGLVARGRSVLPAVFTFLVFIPGAPEKTQQTMSPSGTLSYPIPRDSTQGNLLLEIVELSTGARVGVTVVVRPTNPLWSISIADVPLFAILLGLILLFLVVLLFRDGLFGRTLIGRSRGVSPAARPAREARRPKAPLAPSPSPMTVACKACGTAIEVTRSKRPIEVMCPNCGETQMVE